MSVRRQCRHPHSGPQNRGHARQVLPQLPSRASGTSPNIVHAVNGSQSLNDGNAYRDLFLLPLVLYGYPSAHVGERVRQVMVIPGSRVLLYAENRVRLGDITLAGNDHIKAASQTTSVNMLPGVLAIAVLAKAIALSAFAAGPAPGQIKNLVTFGYSYTDVVSAQLSVSSVPIQSNFAGCDR